MKMNTEFLFVNPPNSTDFHLDKAISYEESNVGNQHLLLPRIPFEVIGAIPDELGKKDVVLLDIEWWKNPKLSRDDLISRVVDYNPRFVLTELISVSSADSLDWMTSEIKKRLPAITIVMGGQGVTLLEERVFQYCPSIDIAYSGNSADISKLAYALAGFRSLDEVPAVLFRQNGSIKKNHPSKEQPLQLSPDKLYKPILGRLEEIIDETARRGMLPLALLETDKGCPYTCDFCAAKEVPRNNLNIESVAQELGFLYARGIKRFYFIDLTFGINPDRRKEILDYLKEFKRGHRDFTFRCVTRADILNEEFVSGLAEAGCYEVGIGLEMNDDNILHLMNKKTNASIQQQAIIMLGEAGVWFKLFLMEGFKGSTSETSQKTFSFLNTLEEKAYGYHVQPGQHRIIIPKKREFRGYEERVYLARGSMSRLDFRHDCRAIGFDTFRTVRATAYYMLAYPSTEITKTDYDKNLQERLKLDLPFLTRKIEEIADTDEFNNDILHLLEGVYTSAEIIKYMKALHPDKTDIWEKVTSKISGLRLKGYVDSFGNPNADTTYSFEISRNSNNPQRDPHTMLFWNGLEEDNGRYVYSPEKDSVKRIKTSFYRDIPHEVFSFLHFARGFYTEQEIAVRLQKLFQDTMNGFGSIDQALDTVDKIHQSCRVYGFCSLMLKAATP